MKILILNDHSEQEGQKDAIAGSHAFYLKKWVEGAGMFQLGEVEVIRLSDSRWDGGHYDRNAKSDEITAYKPDFIIGLGNDAFKFLNPNGSNVSDERGYPFFNYEFNTPCLCTIAPRTTFMDFSLSFLAQADFIKAAHLMRTNWKPREYKINYLPSFQDAVDALRKFQENKTRLSFDIETRSTGFVTCVGFAYANDAAITIPFEYLKWTPEQTLILWREIKKTLEVCPLFGHNATQFDLQTLLAKYGIIPKVLDDTMIAHWELYPDREKSLSFCGSIFTDNVYWKGMLHESRSGKVPRYEEFRYNALDCIVCYQVMEALEARFKNEPPAMYEHYKFTIRVSRAYQYMQRRGCKIDDNLRREKLDALIKSSKDLQVEVNDLIGGAVNVRSPKQMKDALYVQLGLPAQFKAKKVKGGGREKVESADALSLYKLVRKYPDKVGLRKIVQLRKILKQISFLESIGINPDGYCRWAFNTVGTKVGRSSGSIPFFDKGIQPQNVDRDFRDLFIPPEGYYWVKADLEGADSVTMGACLKAIGQPALYEDTLNHVKPAQRVALQLITGQNFIDAPANEVKAHKHLLKSAEGKDIYHCAKVVNHGSAYKLGADGMSDQILKETEGELYLSPQECQRAQTLLFSRYNYPAYHKVIDGIMNRDPVLCTAFGQIRRFYDRPGNNLLREMCSYLPQAHTPYVTNKVIERFYYDPRARLPDGTLLLSLCNQVHDELCGFVKEENVDLLQSVFREFCHVPLNIWGVDFNIEFEANYGKTWGSCDKLINLYD